MSAAAPPPDRPEAAAGRPVGRRAFLGIVGLGVSSLVWGGAATRWLDGATSALPTALRDVVPGGTGWRIYAVNPPFPVYDEATWRLRVDGLVEEPRTFTMAELRALRRADQVTDFHCVTGWSVPQVHWGGVRIDDLLAAVGVSPAAGAIEFASAEKPYVDSLSLQQARAAGVMLAYEMEHAPITREHGAPARLVVPQMYGYKGVKWVERITLTRRQSLGYWEQRGYDQDAYVGSSNGV